MTVTMKSTHESYPVPIHRRARRRPRHLLVCHLRPAVVLPAAQIQQRLHDPGPTHLDGSAHSVRRPLGSVHSLFRVKRKFFRYAHHQLWQRKRHQHDRRSPLPTRSRSAILFPRSLQHAERWLRQRRNAGQVPHRIRQRRPWQLRRRQRCSTTASPHAPGKT